MNLLNIKKLAAALAVACSLAFATSAHAHLIHIDDYVIGGLGNPSGESAWIEDTLSLPEDSLIYLNKVGIPGGGWENDGAVDGSFFDTRNFGEFEGEVSWDLTGTGYSLAYVLVKSGSDHYTLFGVSADQVLSSGGWDDIFNHGGAPGISHISFFGGPGATTVPDSGATVAFIALGLATLGFAARRRKA